MPDISSSKRLTPPIFLSYASQDAEAARQIADILSSDGLEVWFDRSELRGGDAWDQKIRRQIKECSLFVPIISEHTQARAEGYFRLEWHLAEQRSYLMAHDQPFLVPVVIDATSDAEARVPERFRERQWIRVNAGERSADFVYRVKQLLAGMPAAEARIPERAPVVAASAAPERSIAVLAFTNMSGDRENEYFSDGVSDELLTALQKIPGLRVAARTSSFSFKGKNATVQEIGSRLNVANLVEGSVQKSGNRVKITARLSRVATGEECWSKSYTRELSDVFALQEELAIAIVGELRGKLGSGDVAAEVHAALKGGTVKPEAYEQYLLGKQHSAQFSTKHERRAVAHFEKAVETDPSFALAWAGLSHSLIYVCGYDGNVNRMEFDAMIDRAKMASRKALELVPDLPAALSAVTKIQFCFDYDCEAAEITAERVLQLAPADPEAIVTASQLRAVMGKGRSVEMARRAAALDPINPKVRAELAFSLLLNDNFEEARGEFERIVEIAPNSELIRSGRALTYVNEGLYQQALDSMNPGDSDWAATWTRALAYAGLKDRAHSMECLQDLVANHADTAAIQVAGIYASLGDADDAFLWLERARRQRDPGLVQMFTSRAWNGIRSDSRWVPFWASVGPSFARRAAATQAG
jgi:TolB-like protein/Flp pilus assembly protein TadD